MAESALPEVVLQDGAVALAPELVVDREVRQVEVRVRHARVLPIEDPDGAVVKQVGVQEVVVAEHLRPEGASRLDA